MMWQENLPQSKQAGDDETLKQADGKIDELVKSQKKIQFEADALALARDASQLAMVYSEEQKTERGSRLAKVMHLKQENNIGSSIVTTHMHKHCKHIAGPKSEILLELDQA